jgi:hypothetical protein
MAVEPLVVFRRVAPSPGLLWKIHQHAQQLSRFYPRITHCNVAVDRPENHSRSGNPCRVRVVLSVPGSTIVVTREAVAGPSSRRSSGDAAAEPHGAAEAVRQAFEIARRRLQDFARRQRGAVKRHSDAEPSSPPRRLDATDRSVRLQPDRRQVRLKADTPAAVR